MKFSILSSWDVFYRNISTDDPPPYFSEKSVEGGGSSVAIWGDGQKWSKTYENLFFLTLVITLGKTNFCKFLIIFGHPTVHHFYEGLQFRDAPVKKLLRVSFSPFFVNKPLFFF